MLGPKILTAEYLRNLRKCLEAEEMMLQKEDHSEEEKKSDEHEELEAVGVGSDVIETLGDGKTTVLQYDSFLSHQRYYDDYKHRDVSLISYTFLEDAYGHNSDRKGGIELVIGQDRALGRPGMCWDSSFVLAEHLIAKRESWLVTPTTGESNGSDLTRVVELGAGTGVAGLALAKTLPCHVTVTDLPEVTDLIRSNMALNFGRPDRKSVHGDTIDETMTVMNYDGRCRGTAEAKILRWGHEEDYKGAPYDVIVGADINASVYDHDALARTLHALAGPETKIYIAYRTRMDDVVTAFGQCLAGLFEKFEVVAPISRNKNPGVLVIEASRKL